jgi:hypothetical protein
MTREYVRKSGFTCAVRPHDSMNFALMDGKVESLEYFLACNRGM